jgi:Tol biopolymer transport system component
MIDRDHRAAHVAGPLPLGPEAARWREVQRLLDAALDRSSESRAGFLAEACGADHALHEQVARLLHACVRADRSGGMLVSPAAEVAGPMLAELSTRDAEAREARVESLRTALSARYTIDRILAEGDLASVVLARDLRHDRRVAIKVLARDLVSDAGVERFLREIHLTARLNHPHVLPVYDSGEVAGLLYYVMPYAEGETLRARLVREGPLPLPDAIRLFRELSDALAYAHANGVVHRDLKPENVLLSGGHAVVADFGIAEALAAAGFRGQLASEHTAELILGTPAYMAPEQSVPGRRVDHRADLYALGVVTYEMLTGSRPAGMRGSPTREGADRTDALALGGGVPSVLAGLVHQCLAEDPARRPVSAAAVVEALDDLPRATRPPRFRAWTRVVWGGLTGLGAVVAAVFLADSRGPDLEFGPVRSVTRDPGIEMHPALSPDGTRLLYSAGPIGEMKVYVRDLEGGVPIPIAPGVAGNQGFPVWSPDGSRILFRSGLRFVLLDSLDGEPRVLRPRGEEGTSSWTPGTWSPTGDAFAYVDGDTLFAVPLSGGEPRRLGIVPEGHSPVWSPDGRWIAVVSGNYAFAIGASDLGNMAASALVLVPAAGGAPISLTDRRDFQTSPAWLPDSRHLVFMSTRGGGRDLYLMRIADGGRPAGPPIRLTTDLDVATFAISRDGKTLAYAAFENASNVWAIDIPGRGVATGASARQLTRGTDYVEGVSVSPNGKWLAFDSDRAGNSDIYVMPVAGGPARRVTTDSGFEFDPDWSPDGTRLAYQSSRSGSRDVYVIGIDGSNDQLVAGGPHRESAPSWSPDGRRLVFFSTRTGRQELFTSTLDSAGAWGEPRQLTHTSGTVPSWSPDGTRILYTCWRPDGVCFIAPDGSENRRFLSGGQFPGARPITFFSRWAPDGRTIYALALGDSGRWRFWAFPAAGGPPRLVVRFDDPERQPGRAQFAIDGRTLYFTLRRRESDIKAMAIQAIR